MRVNPETFIIEGADGHAWVRRQHPPPTTPRLRGLPGAWAHVEPPGEATELERPSGNRPPARAMGGKVRPEPPAVNGRWESDPPIVVMKPAKESSDDERAERRGGPSRDPGSGHDGPHSEVDTRLPATAPGVGEGAWLALDPGHLLGRAGCGNAACPDL